MLKNTAFWRRYGLALALFTIALSARFLLPSVGAGLAYITFYPGLLICALALGMRPALFYIALATPAGAYFFIPPFYVFEPTDLAPMSAFFSVSLLSLIILGYYQLRARRKAEAEIQRLNSSLQQRLNDTDLRLQLAARASNIGFWDWDMRSNEVYYSPVWKSQLGYADDALSNQFAEWESRVHPDDLAGALQRVQAYIAAPTGEFENEVRMRHRDGSYRWILARSQAQLDSSGKPYRMLGSHIDITERKQAQDALQESKNLLQVLIEQAPVSLAMFDLDMRYLYVSRQWLSDYFIADREIIGHAHYEIFPEISDEWKAVHRRGLAGEIIRSEEDRFERADGSVQWLRWGVLPWRNAIGAVGGIIIFSEDISARKQIKASLSDSQEMLRLALEAAHIGHWDLNLDTKVTTRSLIHGQIFGYTEPLPEWGYKIFLEHVHPDDRSQVDQSFQAALVTQSAWEVECRIQRTDQALHWIVAQGQVFKSVAGKATRMVGIVTDITERKLLELAILASEQKYSILFSQATFPTAITRLVDFKITEVNDAFLKEFGYAKEEVIGKTSLEIGLVRDAEKREKVLSAINASKEANLSELTFFTKSGKALSVIVNNHRLFISGQEFILSTMQDITEQKQSMEKIAAQLDELLRWQKLTLGREGRVIELKFEVNKLLAAQGQPPRYGDLT